MSAAPTPVRPSTVCGCTPAVGRDGSTCFAAAATSRGACWPGEGNTVAEARANHDRMANKSVNELVSFFDAIAKELPAPPILIGHSFGGLIAERLLGEGVGRAAVAIDPAQIKGVLPLPLAQSRATLPVLVNPLNVGKAVADEVGVPGRASAMRSAGGSPIPCSTSGPFRRRRARCSKRHWPISSLMPDQGSTPPTARAARRRADRHRRPHGARRHHAGHVQAVSPLAGGDRAQAVRRPAPLADHRPRLARTWPRRCWPG